jgi:putative nucleotidyltransferase with HDIG domain
MSDLIVATLLHDVGKCRISPELINKEGELSAGEQAIVRKHVEFGVEWLRKRGYSPEVRKIVECHHENFDGSGYPKGLRGGEIPLGARILKIVDHYDALRTPRSYRNFQAMSIQEAYREIMAGRGTLFDPELVDLLPRVLAIH